MDEYKKSQAYASGVFSSLMSFALAKEDFNREILKRIDELVKIQKALDKEGKFLTVCIKEKVYVHDC